MQTFGWLEMPLFLIRISIYIPSKLSECDLFILLLIISGRLPLEASAFSLEIGLKMTEGFYIIKDRNVRSGEGEREMLFDRAAKGKKSKELKGELKDLKKSLLNAGGEKAYVNEALRDYQAALEQGIPCGSSMRRREGHLAQSRAAIERLLECMKESPVSEVKKSLDELMEIWTRSIMIVPSGMDDLDFQSTIQSLKQMAAEYEEHAAKAQTEAGSKLAAIMLRSELENVAAVLKDAAGWEERISSRLHIISDIENRGSLREMRMRSATAIWWITAASVSGTGFWNCAAGQRRSRWCVL